MHCAIDANLLIYFFDNDHPLHPIVVEMFHAAEESELKVSGSELLVAELLTYSKLSDSAARDIEGRLKLLPISYHPVSLEIFVLAAALRRQHPSLKLNDAIHVAAAVEAKANRFITNDKNIIKLKKIDSLDIVPLDA